MSGAATALVLGVSIGRLMQPDLNAGAARPQGPQMFADWAGRRSTGPFDAGTTFAADQGRLPDYVMGTDAKRAMAWPDEHAPPPPRLEAASDEPPAPPDDDPRITRTVYENATPADEGDAPPGH